MPTPTKPHAAAASSVRPCRVVDRGPGRDRAQINLLELGIVAVLVLLLVEQMAKGTNAAHEPHHCACPKPPVPRSESHDLGKATHFTQFFAASFVRQDDLG